MFGKLIAIMGVVLILMSIIGAVIGLTVELGSSKPLVLNIVYACAAFGGGVSLVGGLLMYENRSK